MPICFSSFSAWHVSWDPVWLSFIMPLHSILASCTPRESALRPKSQLHSQRDGCYQRACSSTREPTFPALYSWSPQHNNLQSILCYACSGFFIFYTTHFECFPRSEGSGFSNFNVLPASSVKCCWWPMSICCILLLVLSLVIWLHSGQLLKAHELKYWRGCGLLSGILVCVKCWTRRGVLIRIWSSGQGVECSTRCEVLIRCVEDVCCLQYSNPNSNFSTSFWLKIETDK